MGNGELVDKSRSTLSMRLSRPSQRALHKGEERNRHPAGVRATAARPAKAFAEARLSHGIDMRASRNRYLRLERAVARRRAVVGNLDALEPRSSSRTKSK